MAFSQRWLQFRLRDLFAVVTMLAIFFALGLPWLQNSRELARDEFCKNKLRQIGIALHTYAELDPAGRFCSGQSDFEYVGSPDNHGWMAEVMQIDSSLLGRMSCPANPAVASEMLNGLYGGTLSSPKIVDSVKSADGFCGAATWHNLSGGSGQEFAGTLPKTPERAALISRVVSEKGLLTNYTPSWFLTRSVPKLSPNSDRSGFLIFSSTGTGDMTSPDVTLGGLTRRTLEASPVVSSNIPVVGDGAADRQLSFPLSYGRKLPGGGPDPFFERTRGFTAYVGAKLVANTTRGPVTWNAATNRLDPLIIGVNVKPQEQAERVGAPLTNRYMQDTRQWQAWHHVGKDAHCNLLMADGSVISVADQNGDGLLNPGFPIPAGLTEVDYAATGYRDGREEISPMRVFSGVLLQNFRRNGPE